MDNFPIIEQSLPLPDAPDLVAREQRIKRTTIAIGPVLAASVSLYLAGCSVHESDPARDAYRIVTTADSEGGIMAVCVEDDQKTAQKEDTVVVFDRCEDEQKKGNYVSGGRAHSVIYSRVNSGNAPVIGSSYRPAVKAHDTSKPIASQLRSGESIRVPATSKAAAAAKAEFGGFGRSFSSAKTPSVGEAISSSRASSARAAAGRAAGAKSGGFGGKSVSAGKGASS